ncbi:hypothetical protein [Kitasatospora sp. NPDC050543]|uniref:hypothetical protein n=1 Tax=Kitasatospora sp. NPDC050543 TaxID=3364054 RepID=UPI0037AED0F6
MTDETATEKRINLRFEPDELALVRDMATRRGVSVQQYLHDVVMNDATGVQRAFLASARATIGEYAGAFPAPEDDRTARAGSVDRNRAARAEELSSASQAGGKAA